MRASRFAALPRGLDPAQEVTPYSTPAPPPPLLPSSPNPKTKVDCQVTMLVGDGYQLNGLDLRVAGAEESTFAAHSLTISGPLLVNGTTLSLRTRDLEFSYAIVDLEK